MLDFAGALKSSCSKYYGTAAPKFIEYLLKNPDRLELAVETELPALVERLKPSNCGDGATRVVRFLASGLMTSLMAVDAGVFTCEKDTIYAAFELLTDLWWTERTASIPESRVAKKIVDMLQMEATHREGENEPHEEDEDSLSGSQSQRFALRYAESTEKIEDGFLYAEKGLLMTTVATFEMLFPDDHSSLRKQLLTSGTLIVDKNNGPRLSKRIFRNRRDYAMVTLSEAALNPWLDRHLNSIEAST